jgi:hypothetical protein
MLSSRAQSTTAGYNRSFQKWKNFATHILQVPYLPADPFHVALYLQHLSETSSIAAINFTFYSINWAHGLAEIPSPTHNIFWLPSEKVLLDGSVKAILVEMSH